jgi:LPXTG-site transpeptidase (sortase) family protein
LNGNELVPPSDPKVLGWWGKKPGSPHGTTLLVGHTVHTGGGTLDNLEDVPVGRNLIVDGRSGDHVRYQVVYNRTISKAVLAKNAKRLFSQTGAPTLVIVTCEDYNWSTGEYASNVVLMATPLL